nr:hypothetical protein CFP56_08601 [Quercus suber]
MVSEMGFEGSGGSKLLGLRVTPMHKRSKRWGALTGMTFPDKKRVGGDNVDGSFEASDRIKMDMGHLEDHIKTNKK